MADKSKRKEYETRQLLSLIAAVICGAQIVGTSGESGIGWFFLFMIIIWGVYHE